MNIQEIIANRITEIKAEAQQVQQQLIKQAEAQIQLQMAPYAAAIAELEKLQAASKQEVDNGGDDATMEA